MLIQKDPLVNIMLNIAYNRPRAFLTIMKNGLVPELPNSVQNRLNNEQKQPKISLLRTRKLKKKNKGAIRNETKR